MNKLFLTFMLGLFLLSFTSAFTFDNVLQTKESTSKDLVASTYPAIEIVNSFGLGEKLADLQLEKHDAQCSTDCISEFEICTYEASPLVDGLKTLLLNDKGEWIERDLKSYQFYLKESEPKRVNDYENVCKVIGFNENNGTEITECSEVLVGSHEEQVPKYSPYLIGDKKDAGCYVLRLEGHKLAFETYDWQVITQGKLIENLAIWNSTSYINLTLFDDTHTQEEAPTTNYGTSASLYSLGSSGTRRNMMFKFNLTPTNQQMIREAILNINLDSYLSAQTLTAYYATNQTWYETQLTYNTESTLGKTGVNDSGTAVSSTGWKQINVTRILNQAKANGDSNVTIYINATGGTAGNYNRYVSSEAAGNIPYLNVTLGGGIVTLNSPSNNSFTSSNLLTTNATGTSGASIVNTTRYIWYSNGTLLLTNTTTGLSGTTSTNTFTSYLPSRTYLWNQQYCDLSGSCGFAQNNFTVTIDSIAPVVNILIGNGTQNYGTLSVNHTLNYTITDTNLANCWLNYNGTNRTIPCTSGKVNTTNFQLQLGNYNAILYANDTAGNLLANSFSWSYLIFENSRSFTTPVVETTLDTFTINVTANTSLTSVYLNWNGTEYIASGSGGIYTKQLTIPPVSLTETIPIYWRFNYGGNNISSSTTNQAVNNLIFQLCNTTINKTLINFTTKSAENPFPVVNSTIKTNWILSASEGATPTTYNYEDLVIDNSSYAFCTNTNTTTFYVSAEIEYSGTGYATNYYYLNDIQLIATNPQNITLYLLNDSKATTTVLRVEDTAQRPFEDYTVQIQSYDVGTGTFYTVGMAKTDYKGEDVVYLNWYDTLYKFIVLDTTGNVVRTTGTTKITGTPTIIEISSDIEFVYDKFENFVYTLYFDNTTNNFVLTYTMPSGEVDSACLRVYKEDSLNQTLVCDTCETSSSATIFCNIGSYGNGRFTAVFYALGSHKLIDWIYQYIGGRFQEQVYAALGNEDASFYAFLLAALITVALFVNAVFGIIALMIGLIIASALGFTAIQWTEMMGIIAAGGIVIWIIKR